MVTNECVDACSEALIGRSAQVKAGIPMPSQFAI